MWTLKKICSKISLDTDWTVASPLSQSQFNYNTQQDLIPTVASLKSFLLDICSYIFIHWSIYQHYGRNNKKKIEMKIVKLSK